METTWSFEELEVEYFKRVYDIFILMQGKKNFRISSDFDISIQVLSSGESNFLFYFENKFFRRKWQRTKLKFIRKCQFLLNLWYKDWKFKGFLHSEKI